MSGELILCVGMHRSGTSLTAGLLQKLGLQLPGNLIAGDSSNPTGYFENESVVDAQESLLQSLGFWWPTEKTSWGMPTAVQNEPAYRDHVTWLSGYLRGMLNKQGQQLAIKDPRTSLLLPAWREAADHLGLKIKLVICLRHPRDVCWSLVWRDGPQVGMGWARAQRLWLEHYRALLRDSNGLPIFVCNYEYWLEPKKARQQLEELGSFLSISYSQTGIATALECIYPEFNHGGIRKLPQVDSSLLDLHASLSLGIQQHAQWLGIVEKAKRRLRRHQKLAALKLQLKVMALRSPWGRRQLGPALDGKTLFEQLGSKSLRCYRKRFESEADLRPHPLISPAYLNRERQRCGLPRLESADQLFSYLLNPDLNPLDPHPWFRSREYQQRNDSLGAAGVHPVVTYLSAYQREEEVSFPTPEWLICMDGGRSVETIPVMPPCVQELQPGLVKETTSDQKKEEDFHKVLKHWPEKDVEGPLTWLGANTPHKGPGWTETALSTNMCCWWLSEDWEGPLLADLAGAPADKGRRFEQAEVLIDELQGISLDGPRVLLAVGSGLLKTLDRHRVDLQRHGILNLCWPGRADQWDWLTLLARTGLIVECRPGVRAYLQGLGLNARWCGAEPMERLTFAGDRSSLSAEWLNEIAQANGPERYLPQASKEDPDWKLINRAPKASDLTSWTLLHWASHKDVALRFTPDEDKS